jgi:hypothetical protein
MWTPNYRGARASILCISGGLFLYWKTIRSVHTEVFQLEDGGSTSIFISTHVVIWFHDFRRSQHEINVSIS